MTSGRPMQAPAHGGTGARSNRRRDERYRVNWTAAVVFEQPSGRPVLHTSTRDLSMGGASILTDRADLDGAIAWILLTPSGKIPAGLRPKTLRIMARVVSTVEEEGSRLYRHGLSFIRAREHELDALAEALSGTAGSSPSVFQSSVPLQPTRQEGEEGSRLARLSNLAKVKLAQGGGLVASGQTPSEAVSEALRRAHAFLKELAGALNVVKPAYSPRSYAIAGVPEFVGLTWAEGRVSSNTTRIDDGVMVYASASLHYRLSANKQLRVVREYPTCERLRNILTENRIEFSTIEERNERGAVVSTAFMVPCEVVASIVLSSVDDPNEIVLRMRNVERFGIVERTIRPERVSDASLDELAPYILAETSRLPLLLGSTD